MPRCRHKWGITLIHVVRTSQVCRKCRVRKYTTHPVRGISLVYYVKLGEDIPYYKRTIKR